MGRRHDEEHTRQNRTRQYPGGYDQRGYDERGYDERDYERRGYRDQDLFGPYQDSRGNIFYEDRDGYRHYEERPPAPYERDYDRDQEQEGYWRDREQRQETRRTGIMVLGAIAVAVIALIGVMAVTGGDDSPQTAQQAPQGQPAPQQAPQQQPQAPATPQPDGASSEQVEGLRADLERQLAEIRASINQLRLEIWSVFTSQQNQQGEQEGAQ